MACALDELHAFFVDDSARWAASSEPSCPCPAHWQRGARLQRGLGHNRNRRVEGQSKCPQLLLTALSSLFSTKMHNIMPNYMRNADGRLVLNHVLPDEAHRHTIIVC